MEFLSLQDLKGSQYFGGSYDKLKHITRFDWDLLVIDEAHEGIDTTKTDVAFDQIKRGWTLHLSGTPFKALAVGKFDQDQIFNWTYEDEQTARQQWEDNGQENGGRGPLRGKVALSIKNDQVGAAFPYRDGKFALFSLSSHLNVRRRCARTWHALQPYANRQWLGRYSSTSWSPSPHLRAAVRRSGRGSGQVE
ncbi:hypothetical protein [Arthrobacter sp. CG_A4]|uniref:hypothetical protein n=1 Tax=Arthrobacter sp. CG_A4 TaxID=3071706 RepID=UPI002E099E76|nr:hypothetical protein [Arthrobacter sp. CG_A4]